MRLRTVHTYIYVYTYIYIYIHVYAYTYIYIYIHIYTHIYIYICIYVHIHIYVFIHKNLYILINIYICVYKYIYIDLFCCSLFLCFSLKHAQTLRKHRLYAGLRLSLSLLTFSRKETLEGIPTLQLDAAPLHDHLLLPRGTKLQ